MNKNLQLVYNALLSTPGMNDPVRLDIKPSRKLVLLLAQAVERGLGVKDGDGLIEALPDSNINELNEFVSGCLERAGLIELSSNLKAIQNLKG
ncbi:hypothetical protein [uncultured Pedobacter sp.]|uniref:hypothetical protein n=1 Tax=uncultured Pedobacter sp. TaxID=246139 RepID=UPI00260329D0|nr:hypothetical protein [uncultured Pedobacter sp.]